jgi:hypothetical protein
MFIFTIWSLRILGLCGVLGAILLMSGDLLYNHIPGSTATVAEKMVRHSSSRLINAGTLGLFGSWFYVLASLHVFLAFRPAGELFSYSLLLLFGAVMISYGVLHSSYFSVAAGARTAVENGKDANAGGRLGNAFFQQLLNITFIPVGISSLMMLYGIVSGHSLYPRWMVIFLPILIYLLKVPVVRILRGHLRELVNDCYDNLVLFIFFLASTLVLWNG